LRLSHAAVFLPVFVLGGFALIGSARLSMEMAAHRVGHRTNNPL